MLTRSPSVVPVAVLWLVMCGLAGAASAGDPATWQVPATCGGSATVVARIAEQVGRPLTDQEPVSVAVTITASDGGGFAAVVELVSVSGAARRELRGPDCAAVVDAVALVVAVAIQEVAPPVVEPGPGIVAVAPPAPTRFLVTVEGGVDSGALPAAALGAALEVALVRSRWRVELGGEIYRAGFAPSPGDRSIGVDIGLLGARLRGCRQGGPLRLCAGFALGRIEGRPVGLAQPQTESRRWSAIMAGIGGSSRLGGLLGRRYAVTGEVDGLLAIDRPEFVLADDTRLHQPAAAGWRVAVGLELEIR